MIKRNYVIKESMNSIELWSKGRLPFEPKGWLLEMRNSFRSALKKIQNNEQKLLHAVYASNEKGFFDVENILFYNLGPGAFSNIAHYGLCFERVFSTPVQPSNEGSTFAHYHRYSLIEPLKAPIYGTKGHTLARWKSIDCPSLRGELKPHSFWFAIKNGKIEVVKKLENPIYIGLSLKINAPRGTNINVAGIIKPLLDGIISGFHSHNGSDNSVVTERIAHSLGLEALAVEKMLMDSSINLLGMRNLLHPFGKGIQWNPADDSCIFAKVIIDDCNEESKWSFDGEIFTVETSYNAIIG